MLSQDINQHFAVIGTNLLLTSPLASLHERPFIDGPKEQVSAYFSHITNDNEIELIYSENN